MISSIRPFPINDPLNQQFENLIQQYRFHMGDQNPIELLAMMSQLVEFLTANKNLIVEECALNGYQNDSKDWTQHYAVFLSQSIIMMEEDMKQGRVPTPDLINECITQLDYLMTHQKT